MFSHNSFKQGYTRLDLLKQIQVKYWDIAICGELDEIDAKLGNIFNITSKSQYMWKQFSINFPEVVRFMKQTPELCKYYITHGGYLEQVNKKYLTYELCVLGLFHEIRNHENFYDIPEEIRTEMIRVLISSQNSK